MIKDPNRKGDLVEIKAVVWLWEQGYEVFRNLGCTGAIDMVAIKEEEVIKIDVKSINWNGESWTKGTYTNDKSIKLLFFYKGKFSFNLLDFEIPIEKRSIKEKRESVKKIYEDSREDRIHRENYRG